MNLEQIIQAYYRDERTDRLAQWFEQGQDALNLQGCIGAQVAFVAHAFHRRIRKPQLIIAFDREEAAHLQNELETLGYAQEALFFPDSFKRPLGFDKLNRTAVLQRTETIGQLVSYPNVPPIILSYPEALFEKVVAPINLKEQAIEIKVGNEIDIPFMLEILSEYGFEYVDFVYEPGQYAVRGGIVDIFSYGNQYPYRVELLDTTVESIRTFNPDNQLSIQKISFVTIVPNVNTQFKSDQKISLLEVLPEGCCVWVRDYQHLLDRLQTCFEKAQYTEKQLRQDQAQEYLAEEELQLLSEQAFLYPREVMQGLENKKIIFFGSEPPAAFSATTLAYHSLPQPHFNKNFDLLIKDLQGHQAEGYQIFLFAESSKQVERFYSIFEDLAAKIRWTPIPKGLHQGFIDQDLRLVCYTDHQILERYHAYKLRQGFDKNVAMRMRMLQDLQPGDFVTHIDHGVGRYSGLEKVEIGGKLQEAVRLVYRDNDILYVGIQSLHKISKYVGQDGTPPTIHKLGSNVWANIKQKTKKKIKELAFDLIQLYAQRRNAKGIEFPPDGYLQAELESSFIYEDTPDQAKATEDVKADMMKPYPMDRLVCGDVGFGKTEIAIRAAFKAVTAGTQVAILVPTTILALQHANTFRERLKDFNLNIEYLNRFKSTKEKKEIYELLSQGKIDIVIGTHALLNKKVKFKKLGLLIIDEEQKFGVGDKEKLRDMKFNVDTLTLTATPIPRTLQFSLLGARDLSIINTPPPNRQPIHTEVRVYDPEFVKEAILNEVGRNGQVFFIHNRVNSLNDLASMLKELCPSVDFGVAHGQMDSDDLEQTLMNFIKGYYDVLVCTNIIETGLDIPNANTIIINDAHNFGLSDLHQLRGRVGRSNKKAYCYLLSPPFGALSSDSRKRLQTIEQFSELGSGFQIAMKDLDIRGAGNLLGGEQSGFIVNMGYETYQKILNEAMRELKETEYKSVFQEQMEEEEDFVSDVSIEADEEMLLPDSYVSSIQERLSLYQRLDKLENEEQIATFRTQLEDRFGAVPKTVDNLFDALRLRWIAQKMGFERLLISQKTGMKAYFISQPQSPFFETAFFGNLLEYLQKRQNHRIFLKQSNKFLILVCEQVKTLKQAQKMLDDLYRANHPSGQGLKV